MKQGERYIEATVLTKPTIRKFIKKEKTWKNHTTDELLRRPDELTGTEAILLKLTSPSSIVPSSFECADFLPIDSIMAKGRINILPTQDKLTDVIDTRAVKL